MLLQRRRGVSNFQARTVKFAQKNWDMMLPKRTPHTVHGLRLRLQQIKEQLEEMTDPLTLGEVELLDPIMKLQKLVHSDVLKLVEQELAVCLSDSKGAVLHQRHRQDVCVRWTVDLTGGGGPARISAIHILYEILCAILVFLSLVFSRICMGIR